MTCPEENSTFYDVLKLLTADGFNGLGEAARRLINEAMRLERQNYLGVGPYGRKEDRQDFRHFGCNFGTRSPLARFSQTAASARPSRKRKQKDNCLNFWIGTKKQPPA